MIKNKQNIFSLAEKFDLPEEIILGMPLLVVGGNRRLYVENHLGLLEYTDTSVRIRIKQGQIILTGTDFFIESILEKEMRVAGVIKAIEFTCQEVEKV